jgi:hypothetical protein
MLKYIVVLVIGLSVGYKMGYTDAAAKRKTIVERTLDKIGGSNRGKYNQDLDQKSGSVTP